MPDPELKARTGVEDFILKFRICGDVYVPTAIPSFIKIASEKATDEPLPLVPATVNTLAFVRSRFNRDATLATLCKPKSIRSSAPLANSINNDSGV